MSYKYLVPAHELSPQYIQPTTINVHNEGSIEMVFTRPLDPKNPRHYRPMLAHVLYDKGLFRGVDFGCKFLMSEQGRKYLAPDTQANYVPKRDPKVGLILSADTRDHQAWPPYPWYHYEETVDAANKHTFSTMPFLHHHEPSRPEMTVEAMVTDDIFLLTQQQSLSGVSKVLRAPIHLAPITVEPGRYRDLEDQKKVAEIAQLTGVTVEYEGPLQGFLNALAYAKLGPHWNTLTPMDQTDRSLLYMKNASRLEFPLFTEEYYKAESKVIGAQPR